MAFATYTCAHGTPNVARPSGGAASGQSVGFVLTGAQFSILTTNSQAAADVILIGAFVSPLTGSVNGMSFTSLSSFPEGGALGAIRDSLEGLGFCSSPCSSLSYGYVDLHSALAAGDSLNVIEKGVPVGTALCAMLIVNGQIKFITPNSEALIVGNTATVAEPGTMTLLSTGLVGLGAIVRRVIRS